MTATCELNVATGIPTYSTDFSRLAWKTSFAASNLVSQSVGVVLMASALGLWFAPSVVYDPQALMVKMGLSLIAGISGVALFSSARKTVAPDVEFDQIRREIRIVRRGSKVDEVLNIVGFDELSEVEMSDGMIKAHDQNGDLLIELPIEDPKAFCALRRQLTPANA